MTDASSPPPATPAAHAPSARDLLASGQLDAAIAAQLDTINAAVRATGRPAPADLHLFGVILFARQDFPGAAQAFEQAQRLDPALPAVSLNLAKALVLAGRPAAALPWLEAALAQDPDELGALEAMAHAQGLLGQRSRAREAGERALVLKDAAARHAEGLVARWPSGRALPGVGPQQLPAVIAFSLFGTQARYLLGALDNVHAAVRLYPGWRCRFYLDDSVPEAARQALAQAGAELVRMPRPQRRPDALFWRFLVAEDPGVGRFLVRDADSVVTPREAAAVQAWLASGLPFHAMRDHPAHTDLMLAGLWGGVSGWLPPLQALLQGFSYRPGVESRSADQLFLGARVWPLLRGHCLVHDGVFGCLGAQPFPPGTELPAGRHVGDNAHAHRAGSASGAVAGQ